MPVLRDGSGRVGGAVYVCAADDRRADQQSYLHMPPEGAYDRTASMPTA
jgi:hypothetical protein